MDRGGGDTSLNYNPKGHTWLKHCLRLTNLIILLSEESKQAYLPKMLATIPLTSPVTESICMCSRWWCMQGKAHRV